MDTKTIEQLDNGTVARCLSYASEELGEAIPNPAIGDLEEARQLVDALLAAAGDEPSRSIVPTERTAVTAAGRRLLAHMLDDDAVSAVVAPLVAAPPKHEQMGTEQALEAAIVLGALVSWLQTKVLIDISRKAGKTSFQFKLVKASQDASTLKQIAGWVRQIFLG